MGMVEKVPMMSRAGTLRRTILLPLVLLVLSACSGFSSAYKAYEGESLAPMQISIVEGAQLLRQDWIDSYVDSVKFSSVDGNFIENSDAFNAIQITPGFHELRVYFYWDLGTQRELAPALVSYASSRDTLSRTLRFNARAGEKYTVRAQPVFSATRQEITTLLHVDFWIEDDRGNQIVTQAEGRYIPSQ